jgi:hypothetical protein
MTKWRVGMLCTCLGEGDKVFVIAEISREVGKGIAYLRRKCDTKQEEQRKGHGWESFDKLEKPGKIRRVVEYRASRSID